MITLLFFICLFTIAGNFNSEAQTNMSVLSQTPVSAISATTGETMSDVWGFTQGGNEYAVTLTSDGTAILDVTDPINPIILFYISGNHNVERNAQVWNNHLYVVSQGGGGLMVVDMSNLPTVLPANISFWTGNTFMSTTVTLNFAHDIFIDENGICYLFGSNHGNGGAIMLDLTASATNPPIVGIFDNNYVHDAYVRNDIMWTANYFASSFSAVDVSNKSNPIVLATQTGVNNAHNPWLNDNGDVLFIGSEIADGYVYAFDVSNLSNIDELGRYRNEPAVGAMPHTVLFFNDYLALSYYKDGAIILDVSQPQAMVKVANYDTSPLSGGGMAGCWGIYPFLPSGRILANDTDEGFFIFDVNYQRATHLGGTITNAISGSPIFNANIQILQANNANETTDFFGSYLIGLDNGGTYTVLVSAPGFVSQIFTINLTNGNTTNLNVALSPAILVKAKVLLEGPYAGSGFMNTDLRNANDLPLTQPYNRVPWNYAGTEAIDAVASLPTDIVDWVLVEIRDAGNVNMVLDTRAAFLKSNGELIDFDGVTTTGVNFSANNVPAGNNYHIAIRHRNHLAVISATFVNLPNATTYDFTQTNAALGGASQLKNMSGTNVLYAGDTNANGLISVDDFNAYRTELSLSGNDLVGDTNIDGTVSVTDFNLYRPNASVIGIPAVRY